MLLILLIDDVNSSQLRPQRGTVAHPADLAREALLDARS